MLRLHQHQREAIEAARTGGELCADDRHGLRQEPGLHRPDRGPGPAAKAAGTYRPGIKAIVVYPMNALANSQRGELEKFLTVGFPAGPRR